MCFAFFDICPLLVDEYGCCVWIFDFELFMIIIEKFLPYAGELQWIIDWFFQFLWGTWKNFLDAFFESIERVPSFFLDSFSFLEIFFFIGTKKLLTDITQVARRSCGS
jgi:hypothetical protein